jgi:prevent-host-death family protein
MGAYDQAIATAQRALALATASGEVVLQGLANVRLGEAYHAQGDYRRAIDCYGRTVACLDGTRRRERFGLGYLPSVLVRAFLAWCHAELGTFAEGRALGDEGLRIAKSVAHPASLMNALWGIGLLALLQGDLPRALPQLERAIGICQEADLPAFFPRVAARWPNYRHVTMWGAIAADIDKESREKMDTIVTVKDMQQRLRELLQRAAQGERVIIRQQGKPSLALIKIDESDQQQTLPGQEIDAQRQHLECVAGKLRKRFQLSPTQQRRIEILGQKSKQGTLTEAERTELFQLLHTLEELSRQKAQALIPNSRELMMSCQNAAQTPWYSQRRRSSS